MSILWSVLGRAYAPALALGARLRHAHLTVRLLVTVALFAVGAILYLNALTLRQGDARLILLLLAAWFVGSLWGAALGALFVRALRS